MCGPGVQRSTPFVRPHQILQKYFFRIRKLIGPVGGRLTMPHCFYMMSSGCQSGLTFTSQSLAIVLFLVFSPICLRVCSIPASRSVCSALAAFLCIPSIRLETFIHCSFFFSARLWIDLPVSPHSRVTTCLPIYFIMQPVSLLPWSLVKRIEFTLCEEMSYTNIFFLSTQQILM